MAKTLKPLFTWRSAICESDLPPMARLVALVLSLHMSERGDSAMPGIATLVRETALSKPTVIGAIERLRMAGYLTVKRTVGGRGKRNEYRATIPEHLWERVKQGDSFGRKGSIPGVETVKLTTLNGKATPGVTCGDAQQDVLGRIEDDRKFSTTHPEPLSDDEKLAFIEEERERRRRSAGGLS